MTEHRRIRRIRRISLAAAFCLMGAFSLAAQTALFREYHVVYEGNELGVGVFFSSWLLWVGLGALLSLLVLRLRSAYRRTFAACLALYPPAFLLQLVLIANLRSLADVAPTDLFPMGRLFLVTLVTNAPVSLVTGALFPLAAAAARDAGGDARGAVSRVYVLECLGACAGGAGVTAALLAGLDSLTPVVALAAALGACGVFQSLTTRRRVAFCLNVVVLVLSGAVLLWGWGSLRDPLDEHRVRTLFPGGELVASAETPTRRLDVVGLGRQTLAVANGRIMAAWPAGDAGLADAALLLGQPARQDRILLIGSGLQALLANLLRYDSVKQVVLLEPDRRGHRFLLDHLPEAARRALDDDRVEVRYGDPPRILAAGNFESRDFEVGSFEARGFDLVVVDVGDPLTAPAARYFTAEFYEAVRSRLAEGGIFATAITSVENPSLAGHATEIVRYGTSVFATLETVFPMVLVTPGERAWFLAGGEAGTLTLDAEKLAEELGDLEVRDRRFEPERIFQLLEPYRVELAREMYARVPLEERRDLVSTADRPQVYLLNLLVLGRKEEAGLTRLVQAIRGAGIVVFLLPFLVVLLARAAYALRRPGLESSRRFAGTYLLVVVGAASIALLLVLLLRYQQRFGLLFERVGLANALFMLGLFGGGLAGAFLARLRPGSPGGFAVAAGLAAGAFALLLPAISAAVTGEAAFLMLFAAAGLLCGAPFPLAAALLASAGDGPGRTGGILQCADHLGGALGAAVAGVLLVPLFGGAAAARLLGLVILTAPAMILLEGAVRRMAVPRIAGRPAFPRMRMSFVLAASVIAAAAVSWPIRRELDRPLTRLDPQRLLETVPEAGGFDERESPYRHYDARIEEGGPPVNHTLATMAIPVAVSGYGGPLNLLLSMDRDGTIRRVALLASKETPRYITELPAFLSRFAGRSAMRDFRLVEPGEQGALSDLVNITGATISCRAAVETVNRAKNRMLEDLLDREPPTGTARGTASPAWGAREVVTVYLMALGIAIYLAGTRRARTLFLLLVLGALGVVYNQQISMGRIVMLLTLSLPPVGNLAHFVLIVGVLAISVAFGQVYCGLLCPFGAAQELLGRLGRRVRVHPEVDLGARYVKHVVLAVTATVFLLAGWDAVLHYDPLEIVFSLKATTALWLLIGLILTLSLFYFRFWCRYLCPVGAFFSLFNRAPLLRRLTRPKSPAHCDLGIRHQTDPDCLQCNRCVKMGYGPELTPPGAATRRRR